MADCWAELAGLIALVDHALHSAIGAQTSKWGFGESAFRLLWACRGVPGEGIPQHELAARLGMSPAHVSQSVEQLRRRGWLVGQRSAADRRRQLWRLTPQGGDVLATVLIELESWAAHCELRFGTTHREALTVQLKRLANSSLGSEESAAETPLTEDSNARRQRMGGRAA